ncbi:hypothetical protein, partial [Pantoea septica]|uniref:hypothetical protein n=1 Tax=Pantoea septica TaxID=472695 RepID=UPI0028A8D576
ALLSLNDSRLSFAPEIGLSVKWLLHLAASAGSAGSGAMLLSRAYRRAIRRHLISAVISKLPFALLPPYLLNSCFIARLKTGIFKTACSKHLQNLNILHIIPGLKYSSLNIRAGQRYKL